MEGSGLDRVRTACGGPCVLSYGESLTDSAVVATRRSRSLRDGHRSSVDLNATGHDVMVPRHTLVDDLGVSPWPTAADVRRLLAGVRD